MTEYPQSLRGAQSGIRLCGDRFVLREFVVTDEETAVIPARTLTLSKFLSRFQRRRGGERPLAQTVPSTADV